MRTMFHVDGVRTIEEVARKQAQRCNIASLFGRYDNKDDPFPGSSLAKLSMSVIVEDGTWSSMAPVPQSIDLRYVQQQELVECDTGLHTLGPDE